MLKPGGMLQAQPRTIKAAGEQLHLEFEDNNSERIEVAWTPFTGSGGPFTFMGWFRLPSGDTTADRVIAEFGDTSGNGTRVTFRIDGNGDTLRLEVGGNAATGSSTDVTDDTWHHFAWTYDGNGNLNDFIIYLDGSIEQVVGSSQSLNVQDDNLEIMWGSGFAGFFSNVHMPGDADDIRMFSRELSQDEIQWHMREWITGNEPDLELWLPMHEGSGTPQDLSPNQHSVSLNNSPTWKEG